MSRFAIVVLLALVLSSVAFAQRSLYTEEVQKLARPVYAEAQALPFELRLFEQTRYEYEMPEGKLMTIQVTLNWVDKDGRDCAGPAGDWKVVYGCTGDIINKGEYLECEKGEGVMTVTVYDAQSPKHCWTDNAKLKVVREKTRPTESSYAPYDMVYDQLAKSLINWAPVKYLTPGTQYELSERLLKDAMRAACDDGYFLSDFFIAHLGERVRVLSNNRYKVYVPTAEEYRALGGTTCRCPFPKHLARLDTLTGAKKAFSLEPDGSISLSRQGEYNLDSVGPK